jgi:hypothetical protein
VGLDSLSNFGYFETMTTQNCNHGNSAPADVLEEIHDSQAGSVRHKCAVCAYARGYADGRGATPFKCATRSATNRRLGDLPDSQAGPGRHKCCVCAYQAGFRAGQRR